MFTGYVPWSQTKCEAQMVKEIQAKEFNFSEQQYKHIPPDGK